VTEQDWLACTDPAAMLGWLRLTPRSDERKLRLFSCACARRVWHLLTREQARAAVEAAERYADGLVGQEELRPGWSAVRKALSATPLHTPWEEALTAALHAATPGPLWVEAAAQAAARALSDDRSLRQANNGPAGMDSMAGCPRERSFQCNLLRDLFTPFRRAAVHPAWLSWGGTAVVALARAAYEDRLLPSGQLDPTRLAVLADALEDAGCDDAELLGHLRGPGPHVRGCWVIDLLTGRV
jgi:hypothetical protein